MKRLMVVMMILIMGVSLVYGKGAGTTACNFLKMGVGARAVGMGEAYTAVGEDADAMAWNPAGLGLLKGGSLKAMHNQWFEGIGMEYVGFAHNVSGVGTFGMSGRYLWMGEMDVTSADDPEGRGNKFTAYDVAGTISYGRKIRDISGGMNIKIIQEKIDDVSGIAYAVDLGGIYEMSDSLRVGTSLSNVGNKMKLIKEGYPLPVEWRVGVGYNPLAKKSLLLASDIKVGIDSGISGHIGAEVRIKDLIAVRAGYKTDTIGDLDYLSGLSAGIGFDGGEWQLEYAWVPYGDLGNTHRVSLGMKFGGESVANYSNMNKRQKIALMRKHYMKAQWHYERGEFRKAINEWEEVLDIDPNHQQSRQVIEKVKKRMVAMKLSKARK